jgi:hypothetical protein
VKPSADDLQSQLIHTEQQTALCLALANNPELSPKEREGAWQGWADWMLNRESILEEMQSL